MRLWHFKLSADEPAEAHAAIRVGEDIVWEQRFEIPQDGALVDAELSPEQAWVVGTPVHFHLHNHGENSWSLVEFSVRP